MVLKFDEFSHLLGRSFGLGSSIGLGYLSEDIMWILKSSNLDAKLYANREW